MAFEGAGTITDLTDCAANGGASCAAAAIPVATTGGMGDELLDAIRTPYGAARQSSTPAALAAREEVEAGATLYRIGTTGKSQTAEAQFWSLENPLTTPGFAEKYGIPAENITNANFLETATIAPGTSFITREAPGVGSNAGGALEVVVPANGVVMNSFTMLD